MVQNWLWSFNLHLSKIDYLKTIMQLTDHLYGSLQQNCYRSHSSNYLVKQLWKPGSALTFWQLYWPPGMGSGGPRCLPPQLFEVHPLSSIATLLLRFLSHLSRISCSFSSRNGSNSRFWMLCNLLSIKTGEFSPGQLTGNLPSKRKV